VRIDTKQLSAISRRRLLTQEGEPSKHRDIKDFVFEPNTVKRARMLSQNQIREIVMDSDSDEEKWNGIASLPILRTNDGT